MAKRTVSVELPLFSKWLNAAESCGYIDSCSFDDGGYHIQSGSGRIDIATQDGQALLLVSELRKDQKYTAVGDVTTGMSKELGEKWSAVKQFITRLFDKGKKKKEVVIDYLLKAFPSFMNENLAAEAYTQYTVFASRRGAGGKPIRSGSNDIRDALALRGEQKELEQERWDEFESEQEQRAIDNEWLEMETIEPGFGSTPYSNTYKGNTFYDRYGMDEADDMVAGSLFASRRPRLYKVISPALSSVLPRLIVEAVSGIGNTVFNGKTYTDVGIFPVQVLSGHVVLGDHLGRRWVCSAVEEPNSMLNFYDQLYAATAESTALAIPELNPRSKVETGKIKSSFHTADEMEAAYPILSCFGLWPRDSLVPEHGVAVLSSFTVSSADRNAIRLGNKLLSSFIRSAVTLSLDDFKNADKPIELEEGQFKVEGLPQAGEEDGVYLVATTAESGDKVNLRFLSKDGNSFIFDSIESSAKRPIKSGRNFENAFTTSTDYPVIYGDQEVGNVLIDSIDGYVVRYTFTGGSKSFSGKGYIESPKGIPLFQVHDSSNGYIGTVYAVDVLGKDSPAPESNSDPFYDHYGMGEAEAMGQNSLFASKRGPLNVRKIVSSADSISLQALDSGAFRLDTVLQSATGDFVTSSFTGIGDLRKLRTIGEQAGFTLPQLLGGVTFSDKAELALIKDYLVSGVKLSPDKPIGLARSCNSWVLSNKAVDLELYKWGLNNPSSIFDRLPVLQYDPAC